MPPRTVKRGAAAAALKRSHKITKLTSNKENQHHDSTAEVPKAEENSSNINGNSVLNEKGDDAVVAIGDKIDVKAQDVSNSDEKGLISPKKDAKDLADELGKEEKLELEDNEPYDEQEEYGGADYDDKKNGEEIGKKVGDEVEEVGDEVEEVGDEPEEDTEEDDLVEVEVDEIAEEELEEDVEEYDGEEEEAEPASDELELPDDDVVHAEGEIEHGNKEVENADEMDNADMVDAAEEEEHHEVFKERRKRKEYEIFVGGLDKDATEDDIRKVFNQVGEIVEVRLIVNSQTKKNKGFAFLRFATVEQAKHAVELKNPVINGKQCGISPSQDSDTLFLGNICKSWTKEALKEKLKHYGVDSIDDLTLVEDNHKHGMNRGFAFLEFSSRSDSMDAIKRLQKRDVLFGVDRPAKVSFAESFIDPGDEVMAQVKTVFIDGLPASWDEDRVREVLKMHGEIVKIELARNMSSAKRKDFGFITFVTHDTAVDCAKSINNTELVDGDHKAKVRARLSRPLQRGRGKIVSHGVVHSLHRPARGLRNLWDHSRRSFLSHVVRGSMGRVLPSAVRRPIEFRERNPVSAPLRARSVPSRSYDPRDTVSSYPRNNLKREYAHGRRADPPPRSRDIADHPPRDLFERRPFIRDSYSRPRYPDVRRGSPARRNYLDASHGQRFDRPPPGYRAGRGRDYETVPGSKRPYAAIAEVPPRTADPGIRHSRARLDYELGPSSQCPEPYSDRFGKSHVGFGSGGGSSSSSSRTSLPSQNSHGLYGSRQSAGYGGSYDRGLYSSYGSDYVSRGSDPGNESYSTIYSSRGVGGSSYMGGGGGSGSYY